MASKKPVLKTPSCTLYSNDISTLNNYTFINDMIITFYYELLENKFPTDDICLLQPSASMSIILDGTSIDDVQDVKECIFEPLNLSEKKFIFAPINDAASLQYQLSGMHWTLDIVDVENKKIYYLDSMIGDVSNAHTFHKKMEFLFGKKFKFIYGLEKKYQENTYDCGMFMIGFTEAVLKSIYNNKNNKNVFDNLQKIIEDSDVTHQEYMTQFRQNIKGIIADMAKKNK